MRYPPMTLCVIAVLGSVFVRAQENWPQFRGPKLSGVSQATGLPDRWSATENVVWRTEIAGRGWSSPIVWGNRIFVTTVISEGQEEEARKGINPMVGDRDKPTPNRRHWKVLCFDMEKGDLLWDCEVHAGFPDWPRHIKNSYASETPCTDGKRVYAYFGNIGMFAFTLDGTPVWQRRWERRETRAGWGSAASPVVHQDRVYLVNDNEERSFVEVLDSATGETVWKVDRDERSNWSTPFIWEHEQRSELVTQGTGKVRSYDLAGNLLWELTGMSSITIPTPVSGHGMVYLNSGFNGSRLRPVYAVRPGAAGDISLGQGEDSNEFIAWSQPRAAAYNPSPILVGDQIYVLLDRGTLASWDARTGTEVYTFQRIHRDGRAFTASPWAYDDKIFCLSEDGDTFVIQAGPKLNVLAKNSLGEMCMSSPAMVPGALIVRTTEALYRIGDSPDAAAEVCQILADARLQDPLKVIVKEYEDRMGQRVSLSFVPAPRVNSLVMSQNKGERSGVDVVFCLADRADAAPVWESLPGAAKVAWKHPTGELVWGAVLGKHLLAKGLLDFVGGPTGHRLWSESEAGFTITSGRTHAEAFEWVVKERVKHTYPATAVRMLGELGGIREGVCIDIGCGTGNLDVELARRSKFTIIGVDIDPGMKPLFEKRIHEAALQDRVRFVVADAQQLPFEDDSVDVIVSRGALTFIPDIGKCLREVDRVLKPAGVAFIGGRYLYTPQKHRVSNEDLKDIVREARISGAEVIVERGQWVKIVGPDAPPAARRSSRGPQMLAHRFVADYGIVDGKCLLICPNDSEGVRGLQNGLLELTALKVTALYPTPELSAAASNRIATAKLDERIACQVGSLEDLPGKSLPFESHTFDLVAGAGPMLIWGARESKMREVYRVLRAGGVACVGGRYSGMPAARKVSSADLRSSAAKTGIATIRVLDDGGQWVEIRKGVGSDEWP